VIFVQYLAKNKHIFVLYISTMCHYCSLFGLIYYFSVPVSLHFTKLFYTNKCWKLFLCSFSENWNRHWNLTEL